MYRLLKALSDGRTEKQGYFCATGWLQPILTPPCGTQVSTNLKVLLRGPCTEGGESETRQSARFLMDLVFQWLLSNSLKQGFD